MDARMQENLIEDEPEESGEQEAQPQVRIS